MAGLFVFLNTGFFLFALGLPILLHNISSPTYPRREKAINALVLFSVLALLGVLLSLILRRI